MHYTTLSLLLAHTATAQQMLRFSCSQLLIQRLDPVVFPGSTPSPHVHQFSGGDSLNASMLPSTGFDPVARSKCTTCTFSEDFSNYWTPSLYFQARNGSFLRVPQMANQYLQQDGGMTVYYIPPYDGQTKPTAFKPGFRMVVGNPANRQASQAARQACHRCFGENFSGNTGPPCTGSDTAALPKGMCKGGIRTTVTFPTCWDGKNLDSANHMTHVAYPNGYYEANAACPSTHPVKIPQLMFEIMFDTRKFNDVNLWPTDTNKQPFVYAMGDGTGYGLHGDYLFGWQGDSLQKAMDARCNVNCPQLKSQSAAGAMQCKKSKSTSEETEGWLSALPGNNPVTYA